jgi:hypothetical protein
MANVKLGERVFLKIAPEELLLGLPDEDRVAILAIVGKPLEVTGYESDRVEIEFVDAEGDDHTIWVKPSLLEVI